MFIYNVTTKLDWSIRDEWVEWMQIEHMPALIKTNCFTGYKLLKLLEQDETEGPTYVAQYFAESKALYNHYLEIFAADFRKGIIEKWGDAIFSFRTLLEVIE